MTSGGHWTPASLRSRSSKAATGVTSVEANTSKPAGAAVTESPWDIHTRCSAGTSARSVPGAQTRPGVRPYSRAPVGEPPPPRPLAIRWKPYHLPNPGPTADKAPSELPGQPSPYTENGPPDRMTH